MAIREEYNFFGLLKAEVGTKTLHKPATLKELHYR
jgi:hypothetical protein